MDEKIQRKHDSDDHSTSNHNIFITFSAQPPLICLNVPWLNSGYIWWWFWIVCLFLCYSTSYLLTRARKLNDNNTFLNFLHAWFCINTTCRYSVLYYFCTINIFLKVCTNMEVCRTALIFFAIFYAEKFWTFLDANYTFYCIYNFYGKKWWWDFHL